MKKNYKKLFYEANKKLLDTHEATEQGNMGNNILTYTICFILFSISIFCFLYLTCFPNSETEQERVIYVVILSLFFGGLTSLTIGSLWITTKQVNQLEILHEQIEHATKIFARSVLFEDIIRALSKHFIINDNRSNIIMAIINENCWIQYSDYSFDPEYVCADQFDSVGWQTSDINPNRYFIIAWNATEEGFIFTFDKKLPDGTIERKEYTL